jgi:PadR family transcriptional regulator PadR
MCKIIIYNFYTYLKAKEHTMYFPTSSILIEFLILAIIDREDSYGYEISQTIKLAANIKESTLYPILKKLEKAGYMTTYSQAYQGRKRKYYSITQEGKNQLQFLNEEWLNYKETLDGIVEGRLRHDKD